MDRHNSSLCVPPLAGVYRCTPVFSKWTLGILILLSGCLSAIAVAETGNLLIEQSIRMENPDGTSQVVEMQGIPIEAGTLSVTGVSPGGGMQTAFFSQNNRWIVEFEEPDPVLTGGKVPPLASSYSQLKSTGQPGSSQPIGKTALHVQFKEDLQGLAGIPQTSQQSGADEVIEPVVVYEYANLYFGAAAQLSESQAAVVRELPYVKRVMPDNGVRALDEDSNQIIGVPQVQGPYGLTGRGVVIAIVDTGIDQDHPVFEGKVFKPGYDFVENDTDPFDDNGHGTHCAGIAAADSEALSGVAPKADLMAVKVLDASGGGFYSDIIAGIEYAVDPDGDPGTPDGADVISLSLGGNGDPDDPLSQVVDEATQRGVLCVVAAGNGGNYYYRIESPGCAREALTVGATIDDERIAYFSAYGPTNGEPLLKPDLLAPGYYINSSVPGGGFGLKSGTSMATPHVAGAAALLMQQHPDWSAGAVKARLVQSARDLGYEPFAQGRGLLDLLAAVTDTSVMSPATVSLGRIFEDESTLLYDVSLTLKNTGTSSQTYYLSAGMPDGVSADFDEEEITLGPGTQVNIPVSITIDNSVLPNSTDGLPYVGRIMAATVSDSVVSQVTFLKSQYVTLNFDEKPWFVFIQDEDNTGRFIFDPELEFRVDVIPGTYSLLTAFSDDWAFHSSGNVEVLQDGPAPVLDINKSDCTHSVHVQYTDELGTGVEADSFTGGLFYIRRGDVNNGFWITSTRLFQDISFNDSDYLVDIANSFVSETGDLHGHTHHLNGIYADMDLSPGIEDLFVTRMQWDGDGYHSGFSEPILPLMGDGFATYSYYTSGGGNREYSQVTPALWRYISSGAPDLDSGVGLKKMLVISPTEGGENVISLHGPLFFRTENDFHVMADTTTEIGKFAVTDEPIALGGAPTFFSGNLEVWSWTLDLLSFEHAPSFFCHPGHSSIPMRPDGHANESTYSLSLDGSLIEQGRITQSGIFWNNRYLPTDSIGNYSFSIEHVWDEDTEFSSISRFTFEFPGRESYKPLLPSALYLVNDQGDQINKIVGNQTGIKLQVFYPNNGTDGRVMGTHSLEIVSGETHINLSLVNTIGELWEADIPPDLPNGLYELILEIEYTGSRRAEYHIDPIFKVTPFEFSMDTHELEDFLPPGTVVGQFIFADSAEAVDYELIPGRGDTHNDYFSIQGDQLVLEETFDHFEYPTLSLRVRVTAGNLQSEQAITLQTRPRDFEVAFPDFELENSVRSATGVFGRPISRMDLLGIEVLELENITDWTGLQYAVNINRLHLYGTQQPDAGLFSRFKKLSYIDVSDLQIQDLLWLREMPYLDSVVIIRSTVGNWDLDFHPMAEPMLLVRESNLGAIPSVSETTRIHYLILADCPLRSLEGIQDFNGLRALDLMGQELDSLDPLLGLDGLTHLTVDLDLIENPDAIPDTDLTILTVKGYDDLEHGNLFPQAVSYLSIDSGSIQDPGFISELSSLRSLGITNCSMSWLPDMSDLGQLETLHLCGNELTDISELTNLKNLSTLDVTGNYLWDIQPLLDMPSLRFLGLSQNYIDLDEGSAQLDMINQLINERGVQVEYENQLKVFADAGADVSVDYEGPGGTPVFLDGSASFGPITTYVWTWEGGTAEGQQVEFAAPPGTTEVTLTVEDPAGRRYSDSVLVHVAYLTLETELDVLPDYSPAGTVAGEIVTTSGGGENLLLELVPGAGDINNALFELQGNELVILEPFNHYEFPVLSIRIRATGSNGIVEQVITVPTYPIDFPVEITDPALLSWLSSNLGVSEDGITRYGLESLHNLNLQSVRDWSGIEYAIHVDTVTLTGNTAEELAAFPYIPSIRNFTIVDAQLNDLRWLRAFPELYQVVLRECDVVDWTFDVHQGVPNLFVLEIDNCNLDAVPIILGNAARLHLRLSNCPLRSLEGIQDLSNIDVLSLHEQDLASLEPLAEVDWINQLVINLDRIDNVEALVDIPMASLVLSGFIGETHAPFIRRDLTSFEVLDGIINDGSFLSELTRLYSLTVRNASLTTLPDLSACTELHHLDLESNYLHDIEPILAIPDLSYVRLNRNYLYLGEDSIQWDYLNELMDERSVTVDFEDQLSIQANAGPDIFIGVDELEAVQVLLDASGSLGPVVSATWSWEGGVIEGQTVEAAFPFGSTEVTLVVEDPIGRTSTDTVFVVVSFLKLELASDRLPDYPPIGSVVGQIVNLQGEDSGFELSLQSGPGDTDNSLFELQGNQLVVAGTIDHYEHPVLSLRVRVTNGDIQFEQVFSLQTEPGNFVVEIPDALLRQHLSSQLGIPSSEITRDDIASLDYLSLRDIQDWSGLEHARNVNYIYLSGSTVLDLDRLSRMQQVNRIRVYDLDVEDFRWLRFFPELRSINISYSEAADWTFEVTSGEDLQLSINDCSPGMVPVMLGDARLVNLQIVNCVLDGLEGIGAFTDLSNLLLLRTTLPSLDPLLDLLSLRSLEVDLTPIEDCGAIPELELGDLVLHGFDSSRDADLLNQTLESLELHDGVITDAGFLSSMTALSTLYVRNCGLESLPDLSLCQELNVLILIDNRLQDLSPLSTLVNLQTLELSNNLIWNIEPLVDLPGLRYVNLNGNYLDLDIDSPQMLYISRMVADSRVRVNFDEQKMVHADAGADLYLESDDISGIQCLLDASASIGPIRSYLWTWADGAIEGEQAEVAFPPGINEVTLTIEDPAGRTATDEVLVYVSYLKLDRDSEALPDYPDIGSVVGEFLDPQGNDSGLILSLESGFGDDHNGLFEIQGNQLIVAGEISHEALPVLNIRIRASSGSAYFEQIFSMPTEPRNFTVEIPDWVLRSWLSSRLGVPPEEIKRSDLTTLEHIELKNVQDWSGLEYAINVKSLIINGSTSPDLDVMSGMPLLERINIQDADVQDFRWLKHLPELQYIIISSTEADDWTLELNTENFVYLYIDHCTFGAIPTVLGNATVTMLSLSSCAVDNLDGMEAFTEMRNLSITGTELPSLDPLLSLDNLDKLTADLRDIDDFSAIGALGLSGLTLYGFDSDRDAGLINSGVESLTLRESVAMDTGFLSSNIELTTLWMNSCSLESIVGLSALENLVQLSLTHNRIEDLTPLTSLSSLRYIYLANNRIWDIESLLSLPILESVDLNGNYIYLGDGSDQVLHLNTLIEEHGVIVDIDNQKTIQADAGPDIDVYQISSGNPSIHLDGSASVGPLDTYNWTWEGGSAQGREVDVELPYGITEVTLTVTDFYGNISTDSLTITLSTFGLYMEEASLLDYPDLPVKVGELTTGQLDPSELTFELVSGEGDADNHFFEIQGNQLFVIESFSHFDYPELNVRIRCTHGELMDEESLVIPTGVRDFVVDIPNTILEAKLARDLDLPVGSITRSALADLEYLYLEGIHDWTGLEYARNLVELHVLNSGVDFDMLEKFGKLSRLYLTNVDLVDLQGLPLVKNLHLLSVSNIKLQDWRLPDSLNEGMVFHITGGNLESIADLGDAENIEELHISHCYDLDLSGLNSLDHLKSLTLSTMNLDEMPDLSGMSELETLQLSYNLIKVIDIERVPKFIRELLLQHNEIVDLEPLLGLPVLDLADLSENWIDLENNPNQIDILNQLRSVKRVTMHVGNQFSGDDAWLPSPFKAMANPEGNGLVELSVLGATGPVEQFLWSWDGGQAEGASVSVSFPEGTTGISLTMTNYVGQETFLNGIVSVLPWIRMPGEGPDVMAWLQTELADLPEALRYPDADPDGDGLSNLLEYAFVRDPRVREATPILDIQRTSSLNKLAFRYRNDDPELHLSISRSADLINWESTGIYISDEDYRWIIDDRLYKISTTYQEDGTWLINLTAPRAADVEQYFRLNLIQVE